MNIYIFNLSSRLQSEDLKALFSVYSFVTSSEIISGESRGSGYIKMDDRVAAHRAIESLDQMEIDTLTISVQESK